MADEFYGNGGIGEKFLFARKDAESLRKSAADEANAPGSPGPELRADEVDVADAASFEFAREAEVEAREVRKDGESGLAALGFRDETTHGAHERR